MYNHKKCFHGEEIYLLDTLFILRHTIFKLQKDKFCPMPYTYCQGLDYLILNLYHSMGKFKDDKLMRFILHRSL